MTSTEIAQREDVPAAPVTSGAELAELVRNEQTDGWIPILQPILNLSNEIAGTEFVPAALRENPPAVAACILFGREIDVAPMHALQNIHIIDGRPSVSAEQMRAMVLAAGHEIAFGETSGAKCEIKGRRKGSQMWTTVVWTAAMADAAQLLGKKNWQRYRGDMLIARASAKLCRMIFADVVRGMRTTEELEDETDRSAAPVGSVGPESGTTKVSRGGKSRAAAPAAGPAAATPAPATATRPADIAPPPPPAAPTSEPVTKPDTRGISRARDHYGADILNEDGTLTAGAIKAGWRVDKNPGGPWDLIPPDPISAEDASSTIGAVYLSEGDQAGKTLAEAEAEFIERTARDMEAKAEEFVAGMESAPVDPAPKPMHATQTKALQARFKGLGFTDEPDDREARLRCASTILGRGEDNQVETFRAGDTPHHMTYDEAQTVLTVLAPARSRDDVLAILVKIAQDAAAEDTMTGPDGVEP